MDLFTYLNDLAHDIDTYLLAGLKDMIIAMLSIPIIRNILITGLVSGIVLFFIYKLLRSQGYSRSRAHAITDLIDLLSSLFKK